MTKNIYEIILIKPTHYDDEGYTINWRYSYMPSNSLASVYGIARDAAERKILGDDVEFRFRIIDETNHVVKSKKYIKDIQKTGTKALVCMVGVQSNQFPRAVDLSQPYLAAGIPVAFGGFHVAGSMSMLDETPQEILDAIDMGISMFLGEAEDHRMDQVLIDAYNGKLKPIYDYKDDLPDLRGQPLPHIPVLNIKRTISEYTTFDLGRGCPFQCSFCTIINVQGRVSRYRTADDLETIIRENYKSGIFKYFITDDNLARNRNWEEFFDRIIEMKEREGIKLRLQIQVDTMCHRIKGFIEKAVAAGADQIFIGLENINPENLLAAKKKQNRVSEYREMFLAWKKYPVVLTTGYIIGFPGDTVESIRRDIEIIKRELPIDLMYFTNLTPLPGSEDHMKMYNNKEWMDPDLNKYDLNHRVSHHETMTDKEWDDIYEEVWRIFYTPDHMLTILKRMIALKSNKKRITLNSLVWYSSAGLYYGIHPLEGGLFRRKIRRERRPGMKLENPFVFYPKYISHLIYSNLKTTFVYLRLMREFKKVLADPKRFDYMDASITPIKDDDFEKLELFASDQAKKEIARLNKHKRLVINRQKSAK